MEGGQKLMDKIKKQGIQPLPRWRFLLQRSLVRFGFLLAVILGALAFAIILLAIQQTEFQVLQHISHSRLEFFLALLPFFWLGLLLFALSAGMLGIRYSRRGYKFSLARQIGFSVAFSVILGTTFFIGGGAQRLERAFAVYIPTYESLQEKKTKLWVMPEEGRLAGRIKQVVGDAGIELIDFNNKYWVIDVSDAFYPPIVLLEAGETIKIVGEATAEQKFHARQIRPWQGMSIQNEGNENRKNEK